MTEYRGGAGIGKSPIRRLLSRGNTSPLHNFGQLSSVAFRLAHSPPDWSPQTHPCCPWRGVGREGAAPNTHQDQGSVTSRPQARQLPLAPVVPQKTVSSLPRPIVYCSQRHGSLVGPVSLWLTVEASPDSPIRWEASCYGLRSERIKRMVINHFSYPSPTPTQPQARPQPKALWTSKGTRSRMM